MTRKKLTRRLNAIRKLMAKAHEQLGELAELVKNEPDIAPPTEDYEGPR